MAILKTGEREFNVLVSPYSPGFKGEAELISTSTIGELEEINAVGKIILLLSYKKNLHSFLECHNFISAYQ